MDGRSPWVLPLALLALLGIAVAGATLAPPADESTASPESVATPTIGAETPPPRQSSGGFGSSSDLVPRDTGTWGLSFFESVPDAGGSRLPDAVLLGLGIAAFGGAAAVYGLTGNDEHADVPLTDEPVEGAKQGDDESRETDPDRGQVGGSVLDVPATNEVYRAWRRLVEQLGGVEPSTTPGEAASMAVAAGLPAEPVTELTDLFRETRYGDVKPTKERERRARQVFAEITESSALEASTTGSSDEDVPPGNGG